VLENINQIVSHHINILLLIFLSEGNKFISNTFLFATLFYFVSNISHEKFWPTFIPKFRINGKTHGCMCVDQNPCEPARWWCSSSVSDLAVIILNGGFIAVVAIIPECNLMENYYSQRQRMNVLLNNK